MSQGQIIEQLRQENAALRLELSQLKKLIFGAKGEKRKLTSVAANQLNMFAEIEEEQLIVEPSTTQVKGYKKTKNPHPGRQSFPDHLPIEEIIIEPTEDTTGMKRIGEEITDALEYTPASLVVKRYIRPKYARQEGEGVVIAPMPCRAVPKSKAEPGLLAHIAVSKYVEHTPFYRQIQKFSRDYQLTISSSTLNDWFAATCSLLEPLYQKLKESVLDTAYLQADESPIKVLDKEEKGKAHQGYMWVYHNPLNKLVLFNYRKGRGQNGPKELLAHYQGILQCDGYTVYDKIGKQSGITLAGCLVHVRRKYVQAREQGETMADYALDIFTQIYLHENEAKKSKDRKKFRDEHILPMLNKLKQWADQECIKATPKSPIGKALGYTISQWPKLMNIFADGRIELDNNLIENKIRPLALGRKNYLFAGSHLGAQRAAMMYSFFASCKAYNVNPQTWLQETLEKIPNTSILELNQLMPNNTNPCT